MVDAISRYQSRSFRQIASDKQTVAPLHPPAHPSQAEQAEWKADDRLFVVIGTIVYCYGVSGGVSKMARGVVKFFNTQKGYGFIMPEGKIGTAAPDVFVHISDVVRSGLTSLSADQVVEYDLHEDRSGRSRAQNLKVIAAARLR